MEVFENARSVRLRSHLGTYLCAADVGDGGGEAVTHGYRRNCRGTVWAVETSGDDYVRLQGHRGLYLCATELPAALDGGCRGSAACCWVIQAGSPPSSQRRRLPVDAAPRGEHLTLTGLYGRLLRARFGLTPRENAVTVDRDAAPRRAPGSSKSSRNRRRRRRRRRRAAAPCPATPASRPPRRSPTRRPLLLSSDSIPPRCSIGFFHL